MVKETVQCKANALTDRGNGIVARDGRLERREPVSIIILSGVVSAAAGWATTEGLDAIKRSVNKASNKWDAVSFTP